MTPPMPSFTVEEEEIQKIAEHHSTGFVVVKTQAPRIAGLSIWQRTVRD